MIIIIITVVATVLANVEGLLVLWIIKVFQLLCVVMCHQYVFSCDCMGKCGRNVIIFINALLPYVLIRIIVVIISHATVLAHMGRLLL